jgi:beta-lactamase class A
MIYLALAALLFSAPRAYAQTVDVATATAIMLANGSTTSPHTNRGIYAPVHGLIHPLVDIDVNRARKEPWLTALEAKTKTLAEQLKKAGYANDISIEFANIERTAQFDLDASILYRPASMVKVPIMIAYLKQNEADPELLNRQLLLMEMPPSPVSPEFPPKRRLPLGKSYSVNELLEAMISRSDNDAAYTLASHLKPDQLQDVYEDLGVTGPQAQNPNALVTVRELSTFMRILYLGGYLTWEHSQQAMEYMAASDFDEGLRALLPPGTTIAHKFGESGSVDSDLKQIHDCGFVFHPKGPYLLCVLTRGKDQHRQAAAIARISKLVYDEIDKDFIAKPVVPGLSSPK